MTELSGPRKGLFVLGVAQVICGLGVVICGGLDFKFRSWLSFIGHGLWGGFFYILVGVFAIIAGVSDGAGTGFRITHLVTAILTMVILTPGLIGLFAIEAFADNIKSRAGFEDLECVGCRLHSFWPDNDFNLPPPQNNMVDDILGEQGCVTEWQREHCGPNKKAYANELAALGLIGILFVLHIISSAFCCCAFAGTSSPTYPVTTYSNPGYGMGAQPYNAQGQVMVLQPVNPNAGWGQNQGQSPYGSPRPAPFSQQYGATYGVPLDPKEAENPAQVQAPTF